MNILVTGGAGYIGSHVCKLLAGRDYVPVAYDNLTRGHRSAVKWGPLEVGDIADRDRLQTVFERYKPAAIMHFAAFAYVGESVENPLLYYRNNVIGSVSLLNAAVEFGPLPVIFSSSCVTYGIPETLPIAEDHPQRPINPYGWSKLFVERILADLDQAYNLPSVSLRYFNAAGADPEGEIGEMHSPETHLIPLVLMAARDGTTVKIYGADYDTPDGTCIRDYIHVTDISNAHLRALEYLLSNGKTCSLNLANTRGYSVREVIATAERVSGLPITAEVASRRAGDPPVLVGAVEKARSILNWKPARSELDQQIGDAWNWLNSQPTPAQV